MKVRYENDQQLATFIKSLLKANGVSQAALGERWGMSRQQVHGFFSRGFNFEKAQRALDAIGYKMDISFVKKDEPEE